MELQCTLQLDPNNVHCSEVCRCKQLQDYNFVQLGWGEAVLHLFECCSPVPWRIRHELLEMEIKNKMELCITLVHPDKKLNMYTGRYCTPICIPLHLILISLHLILYLSFARGKSQKLNNSIRKRSWIFSTCVAHKKTKDLLHLKDKLIVCVRERVSLDSTEALRNWIVTHKKNEFATYKKSH